MNGQAVQKTLDIWGIVEVMGHSRYCGRITETTIAGSPMIRVDVPAINDESPFTKFVSPSVLYAITPTTEEVARAVQETRGSSPPITSYDLPYDMKEALKLGRKVQESRFIEGQTNEERPPLEEKAIKSDETACF